MTEEWKPVKGWDMYEVSNLGRVRSKHEKRKESGTDILKISNVPTSTGNSRLRVTLRQDNVRRGASLKKVVAEAFLPPPKYPEMYIKHKDGNSANCRADNLYYCSNHPNADVTPKRLKRHTASVCL